MDTKVTRRRATLALATGPIVASTAASTSLAGDKQDFRLKYILASAMYGRIPINTVVEQVRASGADRIDIWRQPHANHWEQIGGLGEQTFLELLSRHKVKLGAVTFWDRKYDDAIRFTSRLGGRLIVTGFVPKRAQLTTFVRQLEPHAELAAKHNITIGIENHGASFDEIREFATAVKKWKHVGVALAPYHLPQDASQLAKLIEDLGTQLAFFYAWQHGMGCHKKLPKEQELMQLPGRGELDFTPLLQALKKIHYTGWTEIFMHPVPRGIPILETARKVTEEVNRCRAYLRKQLAT